MLIRSKAEQAHVSLSRPLCMVAVMGTDADLDEVAVLQQQYPNCIFHVTSNDVAVWPPPPPFAFNHHRFFLVDDSYDVESPYLSRPSRFIRANMTRKEEEAKAKAEAQQGHKQSSSLDDLTTRMTNARKPYSLRPRQPLRATTFFRSLERNRVAALLTHPRNLSDVSAVLNVLDRLPPQDNPGFLETIFVQACSKDYQEQQLAELLVQRLVGEYGYEHLATSNSTRCTLTTLCTGTMHPQAYPRWPSRYTTISSYGRLTNQMFEDASIISQLSGQSGVAYVVPERFLHLGAASTLYDHEWIQMKYGLRNQLLSVTDFAAISNMGWCTVGGSADTVLKCVSMHDMVPLNENTTGACADAHGSMVSALTPLARLQQDSTEEWGIDDEHSWCGIKGESPNSVQESAGLPSSILNGFIVFKKYWANGWSPTERYQPPFSPIVHELADRQLAIHRRRLLAKWKIAAPSAKLNIVGLHMRLTDFDYASKSDDWIQAVEKSASFLRNTTKEPIHGILLCSDDIHNQKYTDLVAAFPDIPMLDCAADIHFDEGSLGYQTATMQTILSQTTCFIGLRKSTYSMRINWRRLAERRSDPRCDSDVGKGW